jgi:dipeptidyl aminopeptidase/acylaminoacyl peptidase
MPIIQAVCALLVPLFLLLPSERASAAGEKRPFTPKDLVALARVSDPQLSPDGHSVAFTLREANVDANGAEKGIWKLDLRDAGAKPQRLTALGSNAWSPRWSADGRFLYFLSNRSGSDQVWRLGPDLGEARAVTQLALEVDSFEVAPDGQRLALSAAVFTDCPDLACTRKRLDERSARKASGLLYDGLFVRHWDRWSDGRRSQLFLAVLDADGSVHQEPRLLTRGINGDVPSRPTGDDTEYAFSPDGRTLYFDARVAGAAEPWSTNFDIYAVPVEGDAAPRNLTADNPAWDGYPLPSRDGTKLYYLSMKRPMYESDRFAIVELDLASGRRREVAPAWDRSAGPLRISGDGRTLYTTADDLGDHPLFTVDVASGKAGRLSGGGSVSEFSIAGNLVVVARDSLSAPADLFLLAAGAERRLTRINAQRLEAVEFGDVQFFRFKGWNAETVQGYVVKPYGLEPGRQYPVAFLIHGGPHDPWLNEFHYRWNPQAFAGAGYAVVAINFHGSDGYGQAFTDSIIGHWGDRPLEDLKAGWAAALAQFPFLAGDRACALGASYGGYMIGWIAGNWPAPESGAWRCLVDHDGDFDLRMGYYITEELWFDETEHESTPWQNPANFERFNPVDHVGQWRVPMLVVHGANDFRVPLEHGLATFTALQRRGIPSELLIFPDENHWVLKPQNSLQWHETVLGWLGRWTRP